MQLTPGQKDVRALSVLFPVFALTGVAHAIGGSLLPSLVSIFHLNDSQAGLLFFLYFAGTSFGAILCTSRFTQRMTLGFLFMAACCGAAALSHWPLILFVFFPLGVSVGVPMSAVSLYAGRNFPQRRAAILSFLNFTWSVGAFAAPLLAGWILLRHSFRDAYLILAGAAIVAFFACLLLPADTPRPAISASEIRARNLRPILVFALAAFLQVGAENTAAAWLSTYALRSANTTIAIAAAEPSLYWAGFLASRAVASFLLLRMRDLVVLRVATALAFVASLLLILLPTVAARSAAMLLLGISLAPVYPLVVAGSFARVRDAADSRWVLASAGMGGSFLPWLAGSISAQTGSLRTGILIMPAALLGLMLLLPLFSGTRQSLPRPANHSA